jgi:hypothetical protein
MNDLAEITSRRQTSQGRRRPGCISQGQDDDQTFLRGHENISIPEAIQNDSFERARGGCDRRKPLPWLSKGNLMGAGQVKSERFCPLHQLAQVGVTTKQVVNELAPQGLLPANEFTTRFGMAVCKGRHRVAHDLQDGRGCGPDRPVVALSDDGRELSPDTTCRRQVEIDASPHRHSLLRSASTLNSYRVDLGPSRELAERGGVGEHGKVPTE